MASADNSRVSPDKDSWASPDNKEPPHDHVASSDNKAAADQGGGGQPNGLSLGL